MIAIVVSIFNKTITDGLLNGCIKSLTENGIQKNKIPNISWKFYHLVSKTKRIYRKI